MSALAKVPRALARYKKAKDALRATVEAAYPHGTTIAATLGRARIVGEVTCHCWEVGYVIVANEATGKHRKVYVADRTLHNVEVLEVPSGRREHG